MIYASDDGDELAVNPDPTSLQVKDFDIRGAVFVVPLDAPIPSELAETEIPQGTLYRRLEALDGVQTGDFGFVPISGSELLALDRAWRTLQTAKRVFALVDLPGARYDVLFLQAIRQIGIPRVEWPSIGEALAARTRTIQRTTDKEPWKLKGTEADPQTRRGRLPRSSSEDDVDALPIPADSDED